MVVVINRIVVNRWPYISRNNIKGIFKKYTRYDMNVSLFKCLKLGYINNYKDVYFFHVI